MDQLNLSDRLQSLFRRYKYALIILVIGVVLMLLPGLSPSDPEPVVEAAPASQPEDLESRLEDLLSRISGAGEVRVLLTVDAGEEVIYQTNSDASDSQNSSDTVIVEDSDNEESGLVRFVQAEVYRGAVVVCQGADSPAVRLAIIEAVSCATGLRSDQISVVKMN